MAQRHRLEDLGLASEPGQIDLSLDVLLQRPINHEDHDAARLLAHGGGVNGGNFTVLLRHNPGRLDCRRECLAARVARGEAEGMKCRLAPGGAVGRCGDRGNDVHDLRHAGGGHSIRVIQQGNEQIPDYDAVRHCVVVFGDGGRFGPIVDSRRQERCHPGVIPDVPFVE